MVVPPPHHIWLSVKFTTRGETHGFHFSAIMIENPSSVAIIRCGAINRRHRIMIQLLYGWYRR
ncbi:hypothetical protein BDZ89DRAFT_223968 [Hymenopellis radicata]|nr:hypothetical protein BDZ89DRAFT_223968 [Hymenopellis radicata]